LVQTRPLWAASVWVVFSLVLLIVLLVLALRPTLVTISGLLGQIKQQQEIVKKLDEKIAIVQKAVQELAEVSSKLPLLDGALPNKPDWSEMAEKLEKTATESGLQVTSIVIDKVSTTVSEQAGAEPTQKKSLLPEGVLSIRFIFSATGEYTQIRKMVSDLENSRRGIVLSSVAIDINKEGKLVVTINGEAGFLPEGSI
jgi:Tfp pilus assembly protein PilO